MLSEVTTAVLDYFVPWEFSQTLSGCVRLFFWASSAFSALNSVAACFLNYTTKS